MSTEDTPVDTAATNAYAQHLAAVNASVGGVRANGDVYSVHGVLICRKGAAIDYDTARKIVRHKLTMPLDKSVELENAISASGLLRRFEDVLEKFSDVRTAHETLELHRLFSVVATKLTLPPLIAQKLTVMRLRQGELTDQTLLGAWCATAIARELDLEEKEIALVYLAAICRDLGMLHIDPKLINRPTKTLYGPDEWKTLQSHVVASHMILKECDGIPDRLPEAVIQHHENVDGTGYPSNFMGEELGLMGQILSVADTVAALRIRRFQGTGRNIRDVQSILHIDSDAYLTEVHSAAVRVLARSGVSKTRFHDFENRDRLVRTLHRRARAMVSCGGMLEDMPALFSAEAEKRLALRVLSTFIERLANTFARSGLGDGELVKWLGRVADNDDEASLELLSEVDLQQRELLWQFRRLKLHLAAYTEKEKMQNRGPVRLMVERMDNFFEQLENKPSVTGTEVPDASGAGSGIDADDAA
ncbi:MAG: HD domain-containing phosphohydrolase [Myxococcota bacterium]